MKDRQRLPLGEIVWEPSIYPRDKWNNSTVARYLDARKAGEDFPPIALEKITNRLLDGKHRQLMETRYVEQWGEATEEERGTWPTPDGTMAVEYHTVPDDMPVKLYAAGLSARHGDRLSGTDAKALAREIYQANPEYSQATIANQLARSQQSVSEYLSDLIAKSKEETLSKVLTLDRLGWTQAEIAEVIGVTHQRVSQFLQEIPDLVKLAKTQLDSGLPVEEVADRNRISIPLAWSIKLEGVDDPEAMTELGIKIQPYDVWQFPSCLDGFGGDYPGRIPAQLIAHVLYFFTKPGDLVFDPMLGSGTTAEVCLAMGRKCYGYDIANRYALPYSIEHNIAKDGWPERLKKAS